MRSTPFWYLFWTLVAGLIAFRIFRPRTPSPRLSSSNDEHKLLADLRRDFLTKMSRNTPAVDRIISGLRRKHPDDPLTSIYKRAIQEWLDDNNRS